MTCNGDGGCGARGVGSAGLVKWKSSLQGYGLRQLSRIQAAGQDRPGDMVKQLAGIQAAGQDRLDRLERRSNAASGCGVQMKVRVWSAGSSESTHSAKAFQIRIQPHRRGKAPPDSHTAPRSLGFGFTHRIPCPLHTLAFPDATTPTSPAAKSQSMQRTPLNRPWINSISQLPVAHQKRLHSISHSRHSERVTVSYVQPVGVS
eukprot:361054-Chlamydomonas_euryale.AAC.2